MPNFSILTYSPPLLQKPILWIIGFLLAAGFCLQNAQLIPGLGGEYQPLIYLLGCLLALICLPVPKHALYASALLLATSALVVFFHRFTFGTMPTISDTLRVLVGPFMMAGTAAAWNKISARWLWAILGAYLLFAAWGVLGSESALKFIAHLGIRVNDPTNSAYFPWSAFFYSEYSYAALAFITLYCWMLARSDCQPRHYLFTVLLALLLLSTRSGTAIALLFIIVLSQLRLRWLALLSALLVAAYFLSPRVERLGNAALALATGNVDAFMQIDGSSAWRFVSNIGAFHVLQGNPLGTLHFDLHPYRDLAPLALPIDTMVRWWLDSFPVVPAQGVAFNLGLFGGWLSFLSISGVFLFAAANALKSPNKQASIALIALAAYGLFVQSGLTCPTPWIALGILLSLTKNDATPET